METTTVSEQPSWAELFSGPALTVVLDLLGPDYAPANEVPSAPLDQKWDPLNLDDAPLFEWPGANIGISKLSAVASPLSPTTVHPDSDSDSERGSPSEFELDDWDSEVSELAYIYRQFATGVDAESDGFEEDEEVAATHVQPDPDCDSDSESHSESGYSESDDGEPESSAFTDDDLECQSTQYTSDEEEDTTTPCGFPRLIAPLPVRRHIPPCTVAPRPRHPLSFSVVPDPEASVSDCDMDSDDSEDSDYVETLDVHRERNGSARAPKRRRLDTLAPGAREIAAKAKVPAGKRDGGPVEMPPPRQPLSLSFTHNAEFASVDCGVESDGDSDYAETTSATPSRPGGPVPAQKRLLAATKARPPPRQPLSLSFTHNTESPGADCDVDSDKDDDSDYEETPSATHSGSKDSATASSRRRTAPKARSSAAKVKAPTRNRDEGANLPFKCEICKRGFELVGSRNRHARNHSEDKLECVCGKVFARRDLLTKHRKFSCPRRSRT
ncbi:hypothetical protein C8J57DRAFT_1335687 [Mycena rebaudengoi]|nr:hypothetical protein C8J57DRAFT_1335687 [Mycena rebaudengoi]